MPTALRTLPGLTALTLSVLAVYLFATNLGLLVDAVANPQFFFTVSHIGSALLCVGVPAAFALVGRGTACPAGPLRAGTVLLAVAATPLLVANGMYLATVTPQAVGNDIGGVALMLLGFAALSVTSVVFAIILAVARPSVAAPQLRR